ncbi:histidine phosphatase family protein [Clostridium sp. MCC353]|uniref:histidine phosphatase family protein n=1 Tax=Clostridium sp. MCC353 TaxID=2592646 RepID=UPI00207ACA80|nr:histidine phosphatase family protein [Clostridium sp. MCC353]
MRIIIVRHGDPTHYTIDSLTEKGKREVEFLSERLIKLDVKEFYVSPLRRAKETAAATLEKINRTAIECEWLREFSPKIKHPDSPKEAPFAWDWLPQDWTQDERYYRYDEWANTEIMKSGGVDKEVKWVTDNLDKVIAEHGIMVISPTYM